MHNKDVVRPSVLRSYGGVVSTNTENKDEEKEENNKDVVRPSVLRSYGGVYQLKQNKDEGYYSFKVKKDTFEKGPYGVLAPPPP